MAAAAPAAASRKRRAPDGGSSPAAAAKKQEPYQLRSIGDYEQLEVLGKGSYGVVVKARDRRTGETVAVKMARAPDQRAVVREAGCLAECEGHPSIVQIRDLAADEETGELFLVMEFVGPSLRSCLRQRRYTEGETRESMRQLLSAAKKVHGIRMIHRDIKPANILVGSGGALKICDFGTAALIKPAGTPYPEPRVGTLWYRSPEQLQGSQCYGPGVDMWALGCVMVELLTGEPLFGKADTEGEVLVMAIELWQEMVSAGSEAFNGLPGPLSQSGCEVLRGLLRFDHEERLTSAEALEHRWFAWEAEAEAPAVTQPGHHPGFVPLLSAA